MSDLAELLAEVPTETLAHLLAARRLLEAEGPRAPEREPVEPDGETTELWRERHPPKPTLGAFPQPVLEVPPGYGPGRWLEEDPARLKAVVYEAARSAPAPAAVAAGLALAAELGLDQDTASSLIARGLARARREAP